jgi:transcriptional regulator with XRE-family HTH domain
MTLGDQIRKLTASENISNEQLAKKINVSPALLSYVISGKRKGGIVLLKKLYKHYRNYALEFLEDGN